MLTLPTPTPIIKQQNKILELVSKKPDIAEYLLFSVYPMKVEKSETQT
jgi:hypothetical protein